MYCFKGTFTCPILLCDFALYKLTLNAFECEVYRDRSIYIDIGKIQCQGIACNRSFDLGLTSAEGYK